MRGDLHRENVRVYSEMYDEGFEPFRGSWRSIALMVVVFLLGCGSIALAFLGLFQSPIEVLRALFH